MIVNKYYCYIFSRDGNSFQPGFCRDINKTIQSYQELPSMEWPERKHQLVYLEECQTKEVAQQRFDTIVHLTKAAKIALIENSYVQSINLANSLNDPSFHSSHSS